MKRKNRAAVILGRRGGRVRSPLKRRAWLGALGALVRWHRRGTLSAAKRRSLVARAVALGARPDMIARALERDVEYS